ncbi:MAG TPA: FN3 associated domain-containing protein [Saprospiraceae bacterium]|nr:FN3 associated domain-containing protein [Saprospiraceae bacterium]HQW55045.1 FN3 associated domain-containing protein [Saprospiraceae bacterium]
MRYFPKFLFIVVQLLFSLSLWAQNEEKRVVIVEIGGLSFENLERAYTPNLNVLIDKGFVTSLETLADTTAVATSALLKRTRRKMMFDLLRCLDSTRSMKSDLYMVGLNPDTLTRSFFTQRIISRSNESLVSNFISARTNETFTYIRFRPIPKTLKYLQRYQIDYLTTIDSLLGLIFKNYQEREKWNNLTICITGNGEFAHKPAVLEQYNSIPLIIYGDSIQHDFKPYPVYSPESFYYTLNGFVNGKCFNPQKGVLHIPILKSDSIGGTSIFLSRPDIIVSRFNFENKLGIDFFSNTNEEILYTINGDDPLKFGKEYKRQIVIEEPGTYNVKAVTRKNGQFSSLSEQMVTLYSQIQTVVSIPSPDSKYNAYGPEGLISGDTASLDYRDAQYLGYQGTDVEFLINFGARRTLNTISLSTLQDITSWIFFPVKVTYSIGNDFQNMIEIGSIAYSDKQETNSLAKRHYSLDIDSHIIDKLGKLYYKKIRRKKTLMIRCLKIRVEALKTTPEWFKIPGAQAWFFTDQIFIK